MQMMRINGVCKYTSTYVHEANKIHIHLDLLQRDLKKVHFNEVHRSNTAKTVRVETPPTDPAAGNKRCAILAVLDAG